MTDFQGYSRESRLWVCPKCQVCPPYHTSWAVVTVKRSHLPFRKAEKHRLDSGKPLILKWFPFARPWGWQLQMHHNCFRCLRVKHHAPAHMRRERGMPYSFGANAGTGRFVQTGFSVALRELRSIQTSLPPSKGRSLKL